MKRTALTIRALLVSSSLLLGLGLVAPCMTIHPGFGKLTGWVELLRPGMVEPTTYSLFGGILQMMRTDSLLLGLVLFGFTILFPAMKLATLWVGVASICRGSPGGVALWITHHAGKFSMLDVLVIAVLIIAIKGLPGDTDVSIGWGLYAFAASVLLSMVASLQLKRLEQALANRHAD